MDAAARALFCDRTYENTDAFSFDDANPVMRVVDVHDGDTLKAIVEVFPGRFAKCSVRLAGIDTPEITSRAPAERRAAVAARDRLLQLVVGRSNIDLSHTTVRRLLSKEVYLIRTDIQGIDKYGRMIADVSSAEPGVASEGFSKVLLVEKLGVPYFGGAKTTA